MSFLSIMGWVMLGATFAGFSVGLLEAIILRNLLIAFIAVYVLVLGIYLSLLGSDVSGLDEADIDWETKIEELSNRVGKLENLQSMKPDKTLKEEGH
jgi:hypothetical protein